MGYERVYPRGLAASEAAWIRRRRRLAGQGEAAPGVGFALSGGGIRSATFCLGVFQALARRGLVRRIDWLSTVSGGGYFGGFLGALFLPESERRLGRAPVGPDGKRRAEAAETTLADPASDPVDWLRQNGRYLSPAGAGDTLLAIAIHLRNFVSLHVIVGIAALTVFLAGLAGRPALALAGITTAAGDTSVWGEGAGLPWSPWVTLALAPLLLMAIPAGWAYWLTPRKRRGRLERAPLVTTLAVVLLCLVPELANVRPDIDAWLGWPTMWPVRVLGLLGVLAWLAWLWIDWRRRADAKVDLEYFLLRVRNRLSRLTKIGLVIAGVLLAFGIVDTLGQSLYEAVARHGWRTVLTMPSVWSPVAVVLAVIGTIRRFVGVLPAGGRLRVPWQAAAWVAATTVATVLATAWAATAHAFAWAGVLPYLDPPYGRAAAGAAVGLALSLALGRAMQFVNNSSHHAMYGARLTRAYLGASNPLRRRADTASVTEVIPGDAIPSHAYRPHAFGGPLHVVNVTINETIGGRDQIEYRDRKGLNMALGPVGLSIGASHHGLWALGDARAARDQGLGPTLQVRRLPRRDGGSDTFHPLFHAGERLHTVQSRQVGHWMAISGAAFTTGLGARTSLPLALLLGLANVRLGYWWDSHVVPGRRDDEAAPTRLRRFMRLVERGFPIQTGLVDECLARFWGPAKTYWYLSDGGHFENTGCYELLRRRVPIIVCCDCGADPDYAWTDIANLVRKARTDFGAEVRLLTSAELLDQLQPGRGHDVCEPHRIVAPKRPAEGRDAAVAAWAAGHAVVAYVHYLDDEERRRQYDADPGGMAPDSVLLILKPSLTGDEPADVLEYARSHPSFPHEPTLDQYFDEAQWESYRRLGQHVGERLFVAGESWFPLRRADAPTSP